LIYHASHEGKNIIFDVTFTDPQSPSNITIGANKDITIAFKNRETAKYKQQIARAADTALCDESLRKRKQSHEEAHITTS
jgi:hypothetical protein